MGFAVFAFFAMFSLIVSGGMLLFYREAVLKRLAIVVAPRSAKTLTVSSALQQTGSSLGVVVEHMERMVPKSQAEVGVVQQRLIRAGYRSDAALNFFYGTKALVPLALCAVVFFTGIGGDAPFVMYASAVGIGYLGPDFWLGRLIARRQNRIRLGLPDVLDLLVICVEAGLGLDQATARTAQELSKVHPIISDELSLVALEQRAGRPRPDAWRHLAERTAVDTVRNLVTILVQADQFGTSVAKTLRTHSETLRMQRTQTVEEMAAKTTVKLIFPLVFFIFPCLFLVTLGPAAIIMAEQFKGFGFVKH